MLRKTWPFRIAAVLVALALCYLAVTQALATYLHDRSAQTALRIAPFDARALAGTASVLLQADQSQEAVDLAREQAQDALLREPVNGLALRALGLAASFEGEEAAAREYFGLATRLTRRDLPSQLWWIEQEAAEGDIAGALAYYDEALRTSRRANNMLMPVLARAAADPLVAARLVPLLEERPAYFRLFFIQATDNAPDITEVAAIGRQLLDPRNPTDHDLINRIIRRFGREEDYDQARSVFAWAHGGEPQENVINGSFDRSTPFELFNWELAQNDSLTAEIANRGDTDSLYLFARVGRGPVARQLLHLEPGRYQLNATVGDVPQSSLDRPTISITCADGGGSLLEPTPFPASPGAQAPLSAAFNVGTGCRYQWLSLTASASTQDEVRSWIDDLSIRPAS